MKQTKLIYSKVNNRFSLKGGFSSLSNEQSSKIKGGIKVADCQNTNCVNSSCPGETNVGSCVNGSC